MSALTHGRRHRRWTRWLLALGGLAIILPLLIVAYQISVDPGSDQRSRQTLTTAEAIERGALLVRAGNCIGCHTVRGGEPYAGGRAIVTPFGDIYASNITPDDDTGIGRWTADDFWRALHNGKSKDGQMLYPAFPYTSYTKVTRDDADAMYAYLRTVTPVKQANREHRLAFPYNQRVLLAFWRTLYFRPGEYQHDVSKNDEWNRGAYLVQGLGHCAACHTPRNALGASISRQDLSGGIIPVLNWHAPAITGGTTGLGNWRTDEIATLLGTGVSERGATFGPMVEVVSTSLQHLPARDLNAMAVYLQSLPAVAPAKPRRIRATPDEFQPVLARGARLYGQHCVDCHGADGRGAPPAYPALTDHASVSSTTAVNAIRLVLNGGFPPSTTGNPRPYGMPPFGTTLSDEDIAAVVSYVRHRWGQQATLVSVNEVRRARGAAGD